MYNGLIYSTPLPCSPLTLWLFPSPLLTPSFRNSPMLVFVSTSLIVTFYKVRPCFLFLQVHLCFTQVEYLPPSFLLIPLDTDYQREKKRTPFTTPVVDFYSLHLISLPESFSSQPESLTLFPNQLLLIPPEDPPKLPSWFHNNPFHLTSRNWHVVRTLTDLCCRPSYREEFGGCWWNWGTPKLNSRLNKTIRPNTIRLIISLDCCGSVGESISTNKGPSKNKTQRTKTSHPTLKVDQLKK